MVRLMYNNQYVEEHSLYKKCSSTLSKVSRKDYPDRYSFNGNVNCLDLDHYEKHILRKSQNDCTMDAVIGADVYDSDKTYKGLLMIEFRMDYENLARLSQTNMEYKVSYSKGLLSGECPICPISFFVFDDSFATQAENWFSRRNREGGVFKNCRAISVSFLSSQLDDVQENTGTCFTFDKDMVWMDIKPDDEPEKGDAFLNN